jgi:hypothetical protein
LRRTRPARSRLSCSRSSPTSSAVEGILRSCAIASRREMTYRTHPTTRRPSPSPCRSSGGDSAHRRPDAGARDRDRRGRDLPPPCPAPGTRRWAIRWAKPRRIGPYQAQRGAPVGATIWPDLQAFLCLKTQRTPCFTRERTLVRNQPRPSERCSFAGTSSATADERSCRASSRLTRERSLARTQPRPSSSDKGRQVRAARWNAAATAWLPRLHGCRSEAGHDRMPADAWISSAAGACDSPADTPASHVFAGVLRRTGFHGDRDCCFLESYY